MTSPVLTENDHRSPPTRQDSAFCERSFEHTPLDNTRNEIRLLQIHRSKLDGHYKLSVTRWPIAAAPKYAAVSYTWGSHERIETVWVNEQPLKVTPNCRYAIKQLHYLSPDEQYRYYWIDAICIDQSRKEERNHQVNTMGAIFSRADSVFVSLGKHNDGSEHLFDNIPPRTFDSRRATIAWLDALSSNISWDIYHGLVATSRAMYWTRVWPVQEFVLARRLTILCGDSCADWETLHGIISGIVVHRGRMCIHANKSFRDMRGQVTSSAMKLLADARCSGHLSTCIDESHPRGTRRQVQAQNLSDILKLVQRRGCADSRDRVFGVLGLVNWHDCDLPVQADYSMSRLEVALRSSMHLCSATSSLREGDLLLLLETLDLDINAIEIQHLIRSRCVTKPPQGYYTSNAAHRKIICGLREIAIVDCEGRLVPHGHETNLSCQNMTLIPECDLLEGDVAVECSSGNQFILRWLEDKQWNIIGIAKFVSDVQKATKSGSLKTFSIYMNAEDLLVWYCLKFNIEGQAKLGGRIRFVNDPSTSYAVEEPPSAYGESQDHEVDMSISDPDIF